MAIPLPQIFGNIPARITSEFGPRKSPISGASRYHGGVDIAAKKGTPVRSLAGGKVIDSGYNKKDGYYIKVDHGKGYQSTYGHLNTKALFDAGQEIENGQVIGQVGSTGISTGPHTHVGIKKDGKYVNPKSIQDLELLIRPAEIQREPVVQTVSKPFVLETPPVKEVKTTENIENINTMANPNQTAGTYQKEGRGKVYATTGDMATDILGKGIGQVSANEIMTMAMNQGYSRRDAKRAAKGLEKFQQLGGQAEMVFDPNANRYNVLFKNEQGVEVNPAQGRRLGSNAKFGASDLLGLGRDVNTLASVISRQRAVNAKVAPSSISRINEPALNTEVSLIPKSKFRQPQLKVETPEVETEIPGEGNVFQEESVVSIPPLLKRRNIHYGIDLDTGLPVSQLKSEKKESTAAEEFFKKNSYEYTSQQVPGVFYSRPVFNESKYSKLVSGYRNALKSNPSLSKEDYYQQYELKLAKQGLSDAKDAASWIVGTGALKATGWATKEGAKKLFQTKAWDAVKGHWQKVSSFFKSAPTPKSPTIAKPVTQPNLPLANELPVININKNALSKLSGEARKKFDDAVLWQGNGWSWRKGLSPERQAEIIKDMKSYGILKKGGKLSASSLMGLPKAQDGVKFTADDLTQPGATKVELEPAILSDSQILDAVTVTPDFKDRKIADAKVSELNPLSLSLSGKIGAPKLPNGVYEKGDVPPGKKFDWRNTLEGAGIIGGPLLASMQKQPKTKIARPQKLQFRAPVAADLPTPQYMRISSRPENLGSDVTEQNRYSNMAEAQNKQIRNQWSAQNAMQKEQTKQRAMEILNQQDVINAQMLGDVNTRQAYLNAQRRQTDFANKIGLQQAAFGNLADRTRWAAADKAQSEKDWASDIIKNPDAYGGINSAEYKKALQTMRTGLGMGKYGMKLKASNLLKKK